ncbi:putative flavoprotein involved in K+ transport [Inquilinus ginsengisoli]|uniref:Flavoprotein involved in K+ transport n=1 Tax=Inquilinus ginsengisoli TaxID=363840 RepID=A0ABU1JVA2_9PROT|nr:MSMEG_0569 family flavin-dependent oxidoreductase [Inquilinus ginsengisoli]MDR6291480.1 putative flavoprotein involved in K+ transport [Inquilinus ginsengisoli]
MSDASPNRIPVAVIGGGQAGLSISHYLREAGIAHLVFEKKTAMHVWREQRWDTFCLVTPNWQCDLPGHPYDGPDPDGFMKRDEIVAYLDRFRAKVDAPLREGVSVLRVGRRADGAFDVATSDGDYVADQVVVASGGYTVPIIPRMAERLPAHVRQLHSEQYRNPQALPDGAVLVVGSGQSGAQIAEDLHLAGRKVHLAVGGAPRCARFYRGKDVVTWLAEMNYYEMSVDQHPLREGVRDNTNHYVTGRDGGRDIDLRKFALEGMQLYGLLDGLDGGSVTFRPTLTAALDEADRVYNGINAAIDRHIAEAGIAAPPASVYTPVWQPAAEPTALDLDAAGVTAIIWCIGFRPDFAWLDVPAFNGAGHPKHRRGVAAETGVYFLGLPWLHSWGSGRFSGVSRDARYLADRIVERLKAPEEVRSDGIRQFVAAG